MAATVAISQTIAAIGIYLNNRFVMYRVTDHPPGFPVLIIALIPLRTLLLPKLFTQKELGVMDDLTANNAVVLASLGGAPKLPGNVKAEEYGLERRYSENRRGVPRQRVASFHR